MNYPVTLIEKSDEDKVILADLEVGVSDYPYYVSTFYNSSENALEISIKYSHNIENRFVNQIDRWSFNIGAISGRIYACEIKPFSDSAQLPEIETIVRYFDADKRDPRFQYNLRFGFEIISKAFMFEKDKLFAQEDGNRG